MIANKSSAGTSENDFCLTYTTDDKRWPGLLFYPGSVRFWLIGLPFQVQTTDDIEVNSLENLECSPVDYRLLLRGLFQYALRQFGHSTGLYTLGTHR